MNPAQKKLLAYSLSLSVILSAVPSISAEELSAGDPSESIVESIDASAQTAAQPAVTEDIPVSEDVLPAAMPEEPPSESDPEEAEQPAAPEEDENTAEEAVPEENAPEEDAAAPAEPEDTEAEDTLAAAVLTIVAQPEDQEKTVNETAEFTVSVSGPVEKYQWQFKAGANDWRNCSATTEGYNTDTLKPVAAASRNGYKYRCVITGASGSVTSEEATLTVKASLSITAQPVDQTVTINETAVFTVAASGSGLEYQWQFTANGTDWRNCSSSTVGYNTDTLKPVGTAARDGYQYRCVITDGNSKVTSNAAVLKVAAAAVKITAQPADQTVALNTAAVFTVAASGSGLKYQWQFTANGTDWKNCSSATVGYNTDTLKPVGASSRNGYQYRCVVSDGIGSVTSNAAVLKIAAAAVKITVQPADQTVAVNETAVFTVSASGSNLKYQWQFKSGSADWKNCSTSTAGHNTSSVKPVGTAARSGYQYRCVITDGTTTVTSEAASLKVVGEAVKITTQPDDQTVAVNETAVFTVAASGSNLTYQWQFTANGTTWKNCSSATAGYNTSTLKPVGTTARSGYQYRCVVSDGSASVTSSAASLKVVAASVKITKQPADQTVALDASAAFTVAASGSNLKYQWQFTANGTTWKNCSSATKGYNTDTLKPVAAAARDGYQYRCVVTDGVSSVTSAAAVLKVAAATIQITAQPADQEAALDQSAEFTVAASGSNLKYQWQYTANGTTWKNCSSVTKGYNTSTLKPVATQARNGYQYRCVITDGINTVTSDAAVLTLAAETEVTVNNVTYKLNDDGTAFVIGCTGTERSLTVEAAVQDHDVTEIAAGAFAGNHDLEEIILPNCITAIRASAFADCTKLASMRTY